MKNSKIALTIISIIIGTLFLLSLIGCSETSNIKYDMNNFIFKDVSSTGAMQIIQSNINNKDFIIIDVRTPKEYAEGHIYNSVLIDFKNSSFAENINKLDKEKTYLIYCKSGARSRQAVNIMKSLGFKNVYNIKNGISEWISEGYETESSTYPKIEFLKAGNFNIPIPESSSVSQEESNADFVYDVYHKLKTVEDFYKQTFTRAKWEDTENSSTGIYTQGKNTLTIKISEHPLCEAKTFLEFEVN